MKVKVSFTVLLLVFLSISTAHAQNNAPVLIPIGNQTINENVNYGLSIHATDADGDSLILSMASTDLQSTGAYFTDIGNGYGTLYWPVSYDDSGSYLATFVVRDGTVADTEIVTITVVNVNRAPVISTIGDQTTPQNALLTFTINTIDPDSDGVTISLDSAATDSLVVANATLIDNGDSTATFSWTPVLGDHGIYSVGFIATDGSDSSTQAIQVTVTGPPTQSPIGNKTVNENQQLLFTITTNDPDGDIPKMVMVQDTLFTPLPAGAVFTVNGDGTATFDWSPDYNAANANDDSTAYAMTFYTIDTVDIANGTDTVSEYITIILYDVNRPPVMATVNDTTITEGDTLVLNITATDPETGSNRADSLALTTFGLPSQATFIDSGTVDSTIINTGRGSGLFTWITTPTKAAFYEVHATFYVRDFEIDTTFDTTQTGPVVVDTVVALPKENGIDSQQIVITVNRNPQRPPVLNPIGQQVIAAGSILSFTITATDTNGTIPVLSAASLPDSTAFIDNGNGTGDFSWTYGVPDIGRDTVIFYASDGQAIDSEIVEILITPASNQAPAFDSAISNQSVNEGERLLFVVTATDPDGTIPLFGGANFPPGAILTDNRNGTATFDWTPSYIQGGVYLVELNVTDGVTSDTIQVFIDVANVDNQPPVFDMAGPFSLSEGDTITFIVSASDPEGAAVTFVSTTSAPGARLDTAGLGNDTASFFWSPSFCQSGTHEVVLSASDGTTTGTLTVTIVVADDSSVVPVPSLDSIGPQTFIEGVLDTIIITTSPPPGCTRPSLGTDILPPLASFKDLGNSTGLFIWQPGFTQGDSSDTNFAEYTIIFDADNLAYEAPAVETVTVRVVDAGNQIPVIDSLPLTSFTASAGDTVSFTIKSADPDSTIPTLTMISIPPLPAGASFDTSNQDGTGFFSWITDTTLLGTFDLTFYATDSDSAKDSVKVSINLSKGRGRITLLGSDGFIGNSTDTVKTCEALTFYFGLENNIGETIRSITNGFRIYSPDAGVSWDTTIVTDYGTLDNTVFLGGLRIELSDVDGSNSDTVGFIGDVPFNPPPGIIDGFKDTVWAITIGPITADLVGKQICIDSSMFRRQITNLNWSWQLASFVSITPDWGGPYCFTIGASVSNQPAVLAPIVDSVSIAQCNSVVIALSASDLDTADTPSFIVANLPPYATLVDSGNATGSITLAPSASDSATIDSIIVSAIDGCRLGTSDTIVVSVLVNNPPVLRNLRDTFTVVECVPLSVVVSASDRDGSIPFLSASGLPSGAVFTDNRNGKGSLDWSPIGTQEGSYEVIIEATDSCNSVSDTITVVVLPEMPPILDLICEQSVTADSLLAFSVNVSNQGGAGFASLTAAPLPSGAIFVDNGNGTGDFTWTPNATDTGNYVVLVTATDSVCGSVDSQSVIISVFKLPPPVLVFEDTTFTVVDCNPTFSAMECDTLAILMSAVDPNGYPMTFSMSSFADPSVVLDTTVGIDSARFIWVPGKGTVGSHLITFSVTDSAGLVGRRTVAINVAEDSLPSITFEVLVDGQSVGANDTIVYVRGDTVDVIATGIDPEGVPTSLWVDSLPDSAKFAAGKGFAIVNFYSEYNMKGFYNLTFRVSDDCGSDSALITLADSVALVDTTGDSVISEVAVESGTELPEQFYLDQNYPNPFNPATMISFDIARRSHVKLNIYNLLGRNVRTLVDKVLSPNHYRVEWDGLTSNGTSAASGVYFYKLETDSYQRTRKMILLK